MEQNQTEKTADKNIFYLIFIKRLSYGHTMFCLIKVTLVFMYKRM